MFATILAVVILLGAAPLAQQWKLYGHSWLNNPFVGDNFISFTGRSGVSSANIYGGVNIPPRDVGDLTAVETWVSGRSGSQSCEPWSPMNAYGACEGWADAEQFSWADGGYYHGFTLYGGWCVQSAHKFYDASTGASYMGNPSYGCFNYGQTPEEECIAAGGTWDPYEEICQTETPIIMPLGNAQSYKLTSATEGVLFDIDGDGKLEQMAWTAADSELGFLAIDKNGNGAIDNGAELFGNRTVPGAANGFAALSKIAPITGPIGFIDSDDEVYAKLLLWEDRNHNGISEAGELRPARELYTRIGLGYSLHDRRDAHGNQFKFRGWATVRTAAGRNDVKHAKDSDERQRDIYDVLLVVQR